MEPCLGCAAMSVVLLAACRPAPFDLYALESALTRRSTALVGRCAAKRWSLALFTWPAPLRRVSRVGGSSLDLLRHLRECRTRSDRLNDRRPVRRRCYFTSDHRVTLLSRVVIRNGQLWTNPGKTLQHQSLRYSFNVAMQIRLCARNALNKAMLFVFATGSPGKMKSIASGVAWRAQINIRWKRLAKHQKQLVPRIKIT